MDIIIEAKISPERQLIDYELPANVPIGRVRLVIQPAQNTPEPALLLTRATARAKLLAAGMLVTESFAPEGAVESDETEHRRLMEVFGQGPSSDQLIDEDRGSR